MKDRDTNIEAPCMMKTADLPDEEPLKTLNGKPYSAILTAFFLGIALFIAGWWYHGAIVLGALVTGLALFVQVKKTVTTVRRLTGRMYRSGRLIQITALPRHCRSGWLRVLYRCGCRCFRLTVCIIFFIRSFRIWKQQKSDGGCSVRRRRRDLCFIANRVSVSSQIEGGLPQV